MITCRVPATSANLGPGFDCLGVALGLHNTFTLEAAQADRYPTLADGGENLAWQALDRLFQHVGIARPPLALTQEVAIPLARGLGSSASAIVAGLVLGNAWLGQPLDKQALVALATEMEGHPDNVAPALLGGCVLSAGAAPLTVSLPWPADWRLVLAIPDFPLSTAAARAVLPAAVSLPDASFTGARAALLVAALHQGRSDWLGEALQDKLHQPYRRELVRGYDDVEAAALQAGAWGLTLSGAGPTLAAWTGRERAAQIGEAMAQAWRASGVYAEIVIADIDAVGAVTVG